ncbi:MAG: signal recognition particle-docking protein FtsY [Phycisphaerales bacterium]
MAFFSSVISKLKGALSRTRETLVTGLRALLRGRALDGALLKDIERLLIAADVGPAATEQLIAGLSADFKSGAIAKSEDVIDHLKTRCKGMLGGAGAGLTFAPSGPTVVLVTGINGAGKTTSIAKLASMLTGQGRSVMLAACDTFRAGAVRQIEIWAERVGVTVIKGQQGGDPAAVAFDACKAALARKVDVLIIDTAGRLQTQDPLMRQLAKIRGVLGKQIEGAPHEALLVLDATTGQNALRQAEEFGKHAGITGIFLAKLDGTAKGGIVLAIKAGSDLPVKFIGTGESPGDVEAFDAESFVEALFAT